MSVITSRDLRSPRPRPEIDVDGDGDPAPETPRLLGPTATRGQRKRFLRDAMIYLGATRFGYAHRELAEMFSLPLSRVGAIVKKLDSHLSNCRAAAC